MIVSGAYFTYDLVVCLYYDLYDLWLILHHFASMMAYTTSIVTQYSGTIAISKSVSNCLAALLYAEIPNLPMHLRHIVKVCGYRHTRTYEFIEIFYFRISII